jgi:hypothetical protein
MKSPAEGNGSRGVLSSIPTLVQVVSVLVAAVISILSFNDVRKKEIEARKEETRKRDIEAARPFLELRRTAYLETLQVVSVLATGERKGELDVGTARRRFEQLYWAELALVEDAAVDQAMVRLRASLVAMDDPASQADKEKLGKEKQNATLGVAHAIRDSLAQSWGLPSQSLGTVYQ